MAGENSNLAFQQFGTLGYSELITGALADQRITHDWWDVAAVLANAGAIGKIGKFEDFLGDAIPSEWAPDLSNSGTAAINAQQGGVVRLTTDTAADDHATLALGLHWLVSKGFTVFRARTKQVTALTARKVEIGLSDAVSETNGLAFSSHDATPVAVADDAVILAINTGESITDFSLLSVKGGGTPQRVAAASMDQTVTPALTFQDYTIIVDSAGNAGFYVGNPPVLVASIALAVATTAVLTPWISIANTTTTAASIDIDYVLIHGAR